MEAVALGFPYSSRREGSVSKHRPTSLDLLHPGLEVAAASGDQRGDGYGVGEQDPGWRFHDKVFGFGIFALPSKASSVPGDGEVAQPGLGPARVLGERMHLSQFEPEMNAVSAGRLKSFRRVFGKELPAETDI